MKLIDRFRQIPMKRRPTATIHVVAEQPAEGAPEQSTSLAPAAPAATPSPKHTRLPLAVLIIYGFTLLSAILYLIAVKSPAFADFFNRRISAAVRATTAHLTGWIPFSLAETLLLFLPVIVDLCQKDQGGCLQFIHRDILSREFHFFVDGGALIGDTEAPDEEREQNGHDGEDLGNIDKDGAP